MFDVHGKGLSKCLMCMVKGYLSVCGSKLHDYSLFDTLVLCVCVHP